MRCSTQASAPAAVAPAATPESGALQLLSLLQREGRFVDFVEQEVTAFSDADVGAAARVVHEGCRRALHAHARIASNAQNRPAANCTRRLGSARASDSGTEISSKARGLVSPSVPNRTTRPTTPSGTSLASSGVAVTSISCT